MWHQAAKCSGCTNTGDGYLPHKRPERYFCPFSRRMLNKLEFSRSRYNFSLQLTLSLETLLEFHFGDALMQPCMAHPGPSGPSVLLPRHSKFKHVLFSDRGIPGMEYVALGRVGAGEVSKIVGCPCSCVYLGGMWGRENVDLLRFCKVFWRGSVGVGIPHFLTAHAKCFVVSQRLCCGVRAARFLTFGHLCSKRPNARMSMPPAASEPLKT